MGWSIELRSRWLDEVQAMPIWMGLFTVDPDGFDDPALLEVEGEVYVRQPSLWNRRDPTVLALQTALIWRNLPPGTVVAAVGGFDDAFAGTYLFSDLVKPDPISYPAGGTYIVPAGEYVLTIE